MVGSEERGVRSVFATIPRHACGERDANSRTREGEGCERTRSTMTSAMCFGSGKRPGRSVMS